MKFIKSIFLRFPAAICCFLIWLASCEPQTQNSHFGFYGGLADTLEKSLENEIINVWYPRIIDSTYGGYFTNFSATWEKLPRQEKSIVYTARHVWTTSMLYKQYPDSSQYLDYARQGFEFMKEHLWDDEYGGYYIVVSQEGDPMDTLDLQKRVYGQAFAIYGLAEYYDACREMEVLDWAKKSFQWIEEHARDPEHGGYFEFLLRQGAPMLSGDENKVDMSDRLVKGYKDYNSSIHLLEALTTLYHVWPDQLVRDRLVEMFHVVRDTMVTEPGFLKLYFHPDWTPVASETLDENAGENLWFTDHVTFGHDIETAFLIYEAAEALGNYDEETASICKMLVDHTIRQGWDAEHGGFFEKGKYLTPDSLVIIDDHKSWWSQVEALNSLLLMHYLHPGSDVNYYTYFRGQWLYIDTYLIDHENGGWYSNGLDTNPGSKNGPKAHNWKTTYHNGRGMVNCINRLRSLQVGGAHAEH
jgi:cellobiose epimerase